MAVAAREASSSSSATPRSYTYHVFLNFRGGDTRKGFTDHLFAALGRKGIRTSRDDKSLEKGEFISDALFKAIEESMFAIAIVSPDYASSAWCLDELQHIVECSKNMGLEIVTVFYNVEPSQVRYQKGRFGAAFTKHEGRPEYEKKIQPWKEALQHIANCSNWVFNDQNEAEFIESIVEHIYRKLIPKLPSSTKNLVGIASRVDEVIRHIGIGLNDVRFVGICGMGGIGKTTIARTVYDAIRVEFKEICFFRNVRELSEIKGIVHLQREILSRLNVNDLQFFDEDDGKNMIEMSLCKKKVLVVLDDVDKGIQLENLVGDLGWFGPGSRIIVTTRDMHLLKSHGVRGIYEVKGLEQKDAHRLFCLKAFKQDEPNEEYSKLSKEVVQYTQGLPLALRVLGRHLCQRDIGFWHDTIKELSSGGPHLDINKVLKISYDHLCPTVKNIFLDIACFFKGRKKDEVIKILKMCNVYVGIGSEIGSAIETLKDKSLVTVDSLDWLGMHDLLQQMGRNIVYEESPDDPGKRSRLWFTVDIDMILTENKGSDAIQAIVRSDCGAYQWSAEAFSKTSQLKFLILFGGKLSNGLNNLPRSLRVLHWERCPLETLPLVDQSNVVEMKLHHSQIERLWDGKKFLTLLKYLDLSFSDRLKETPDLSGVPNLERLILTCCESLTEIHPSLVKHKKLVELDISKCCSLETLPGKLEMSSLVQLILSGCKNLAHLEFGECMKSLSTLKLLRCERLRLSSSVLNLSGLRDLELNFCHLSEESFKLDFFLKLAELRKFSMEGCPNIHFLSKLPSSLRELRAEKCGSLNISQFCDFSIPCNIYAAYWDKLQWVSIELVQRSEILSYFRSQERGSSVSLPNPDLDGRTPLDRSPMGIKLCFLIETLKSCHEYDVPNLALALYCNGKRLATRKMSPEIPSSRYCYSVELPNGCWYDRFGEGDRFELFIEGGPPHLTCAQILVSAADWCRSYNAKMDQYLSEKGVCSPCNCGPNHRHIQSKSSSDYLPWQIRRREALICHNCKGQVIGFSTWSKTARKMFPIRTWSHRDTLMGQCISKQ